MRNTKEECNGITLIMLIVTIVLLLILAGITISQLSENGIFEKAKLAKENYIKAEIEEELSFLISNLQIEKLGKASLEDITQEYLEQKMSEYNTGIIYNELKREKEVEISKNSIKVNFIIDENLSITKIDDKKIQPVNKLYYQEDYCEAVTGGWTLTNDSYAKFISESNAIHANRFGGSYGGWAISTNVAIDISSYSKLCCRYTADSNIYNDGLRLRLDKSKYIYCTGGHNVAMYNSDSFEYNKENEIFKWDISGIEKGSYYIGIGGSGATDTYIYEIWFE